MARLIVDHGRRGYSTESHKGLLLVEKLDYLQSKLLQNIFLSLSKPLMHQGGDFDATGCSNGRGDRAGPDATGRANLYAVGALDVQHQRRSGTASVPILLRDHATDRKGTASSRGFCSGYPSYRLLPVVLNWSPYNTG